MCFQQDALCKVLDQRPGGMDFASQKHLPCIEAILLWPPKYNGWNETGIKQKHFFESCLFFKTCEWINLISVGVISCPYLSTEPWTPEAQDFIVARSVIQV